MYKFATLALIALISNADAIHMSADPEWNSHNGSKWNKYQGGDPKTAVSDTETPVAGDAATTGTTTATAETSLISLGKNDINTHDGTTWNKYQGGDPATAVANTTLIAL